MTADIKFSTCTTSGASRGRSTGAALLAVIGAGAVFMLSACGALGALPFQSPTSTPTLTVTPAPSPTPSFTKQLLAFGSEGKGPGKLNRPESIGVDRDGNIYVGNSEDGRINIFDPSGKLLRSINLGTDSVVESIGVAPDGSITIDGTYRAYYYEVKR